MHRKNHNLYIGELAEGCRLCMQGAKLVLFVSGVCRRSCYYCPLSMQRRGVLQSWANERPVSSVEEVLLEAERMRALGAGITGGDPDLSLSRTLRFMRALKQGFGDFHIHMYTSNPLERAVLEKLKKAGLDELRYHVLEEEAWRSLRHAKNLGLAVGVEVPAIPGEEERLLRLVERAKEAGADFVNFNELEYSETNAEELRRRGFKEKPGSCAVLGSYETAMKVLEKSRRMNLHLCTSRYKDAVQLRRRLLRTALNTARSYEEVTSEGLLLKGAVVPRGSTDLESLRRRIIKCYSVPPGLISLDKAKNRLETTQEIAVFLAEELKKEVKCYLVEEYPTYDRLETEVIPL